MSGFFRSLPFTLLAAAFVGLSGPGFAGESAPVADLLIRGATVLDGTGAPGRLADVMVHEGRISRIVNFPDGRAKRTIEARGMMLSPGFVDLHSHADRDLGLRRDAENYVRQGVTTLVVGNCGDSPVDAAALFRSLHETGAGVNIVLLIGHGSVRVAEMGDRSVPPTAAELAAMRRRVVRMMEAGAVGLSTSLRYRPGAYAEMPEVVAVTREIAPFGGFYATHMRDEGVQIQAALEEALHIGNEAAVPVHVSHHKISSASVWGLTQQTLARIDQARTAGRDVTLDQYPYGAGSSRMALMVPQPLVAGGPDAFRQRLADPTVRRETIAAVEREMVEKLFAPEQDSRNPEHVRVALTRIQVARLEDDTRLEGMYLAEILESRGTPHSVRAGAELIIELVGRGAAAIYHTIDDRPGGDVDHVMKHAQTCIASDGILPAFGEGHPHPRSYGTFPRVLARYVRERPTLSWEEAIHKMTGLPAQRLGWSDRGLIKTGYRADLVLFDPATIGDTATFAKPHSHAAGVTHVWIGGVPVIDGGAMTPHRPGRPVYSVPAAGSPGTLLRRAVLAQLDRFDARFGVLVVDDDGREAFAFNADDPFFRGASATAAPGSKDHTSTLRDAIPRESALPGSGEFFSRPRAKGDGRVELAAFSVAHRPDGSRLRVVAAIDGVRAQDEVAARKILRETLPRLLSEHAGARR